MQSTTWWKPHPRNNGNTVPTLASQELENPAPGPDMNPPADTDLFEMDVDDGDVADDTGAPPFTGEDLEDVGDRRPEPPLPTV